jgi:hypothetical protein
MYLSLSRRVEYHQSLQELSILHQSELLSPPPNPPNLHSSWTLTRSSKRITSGTRPACECSTCSMSFWEGRD